MPLHTLTFRNNSPLTVSLLVNTAVVQPDFVSGEQRTVTVNDTKIDLQWSAQETASRLLLKNGINPPNGLVSVSTTDIKSPIPGLSQAVKLINSTPFPLDVVLIDTAGVDNRTGFFRIEGGFYMTQSLPVKQAYRYYVSDTNVEVGAFVVQDQPGQVITFQNTVIGFQNDLPVDARTRRSGDGITWDDAGIIPAKTALLKSNYTQDFWSYAEVAGVAPDQFSGRVTTPKTIRIEADFTHAQLLDFQQDVPQTQRDSVIRFLTFINETSLPVSVAPLLAQPDGSISDLIDSVNTIELGAPGSSQEITIQKRMPFGIRDAQTRKLLGRFVPDMTLATQTFSIRLPVPTAVPTTVQFVNETLLTLSLNTIDNQQAEVLFLQPLLPQSDIITVSYVGQTWIVREADSGLVLRVETAVRQQPVIRITTANLMGQFTGGLERKTRFGKLSAFPDMVLHLFKIYNNGQEIFHGEVPNSQSPEFVPLPDADTMGSTVAWVIREAISQQAVKMVVVHPDSGTEQDYFVDFNYPTIDSPQELNVRYVNRTGLTLELELLGPNRVKTTFQSVVVGNIQPGDHYMMRTLPNTCCAIKDYVTKRVVGVYICTAKANQVVEVRLDRFVSPYAKSGQTSPSNMPPQSLTNKTADAVDVWFFDEHGDLIRATDTTGKPISLQPGESGSGMAQTPFGMLWQFTHAGTDEVVGAFFTAPSTMRTTTPDHPYPQKVTLLPNIGRLLHGEEVLQPGEVGLFAEPNFQGWGRLVVGAGNNGSLVQDLRGPLQTYPYPLCAVSPKGLAVLTMRNAGIGVFGHGNAPNQFDLWGRAVQPAFEVGYTGNVITGAYSPDGKYALTGSSYGEVKLWNLLSTTGGPEPARFDHGNVVTSVAFSPDSTRILTASQDSTVMLWDLAGKALGAVRHDGQVLSAVFSPDGSQVVTIAANLTTRLSVAHLWTIEGLIEGQPGRSLFEVTQGVINGAVFMPNGTNLLLTIQDTATSSNSVKRVDLNGVVSQTLAGGGNSIAVSPDGTLALSASKTSASLWNCQTGVLIRTFNGFVGSWVGFSPDSKLAFIGDRVWGINTGDIQSISVGPRTAFSRYSQSNFQLPADTYFLSQPTVVQGAAPVVGSYRVDQVGQVVEPCIANHANLVEDFRLVDGEIERFANYRTILSLPPSASRVSLTADEPVTISVKGTPYDLVPGQSVTLKPNRLGKLTIDLPASALHQPMLLIHSNDMPDGVTMPIFPAAKTHQKLASLPDNTLFDHWHDICTDPAEVPDKVHIDSLQGAVRNLARTMQYTYHGSVNGFHHKRQLTAHNMEHAHWTVDMGANNLSYQPISTAYVREHLQVAPRASQDTSRRVRGLVTAFEEDLQRAEQIFVHTAQRLGNDVVETGKAVIGDVIETAENVGKHASDAAIEVGQDLVHGNLTGAANDLSRGVFSVESDIATLQPKLKSDLVNGGERLLGDVVEAIPKLVVVTLKIGGDLIQYVLDHTGMVGQMVNRLLAKARVEMKKFISWLMEKLPWDDILNTQRVLHDGIQTGLTRFTQQMQVFKTAGGTFFNDLEQSILTAFATSLKPTGPALSPTQVPKDIHRPHTMHHAHWLLSKVADHDGPDPLGAMPAMPANIVGVMDAFLQKVEEALGSGNTEATQSLTTIKTNLVAFFQHPFSSNDSLLAAAKELANVAAITSLKLLNDLLDAFYDLAGLLLVWLRDTLSNTVVNIPYLSKFYKYISGADLTVLRLTTLIVAAPLVVYSKREDQPLIFSRLRDATPLHPIPYYEMYPLSSWAKVYSFTHFALGTISIPANLMALKWHKEEEEHPDIDLVLGLIMQGFNGLAQLAGNPIGYPLWPPPLPALSDLMFLVKSPNYFTHVIWYYQFAELGIGVLETIVVRGAGTKVVPAWLETALTKDRVNNVIAVANTVIGLVHVSLFGVLATAEFAKGVRLRRLTDTDWAAWELANQQPGNDIWKHQTLAVLKKVYDYADNSVELTALQTTINQLTPAQVTEINIEINGYIGFKKWAGGAEFAKKTIANVFNAIPEIGSIGMMPELIKKSKGESLWVSAATNLGHWVEAGITLNRTDPEA